MTRRLFLFAGYDRDGIIDDCLIHHIRQLSKLGDVIFYMDNDVARSELEKIRPYVIYANGNRHCGYDFGSYKHCYQWAQSQGLLQNYDFLYFANDSVFGPFKPLLPILEQLESGGGDYFGLFPSKLNAPLHIQSWFIGCRPSIFRSDWHSDFIDNICKCPNKMDYVWNYEIGHALYVKFYGGTIDFWHKDKRFVATDVYKKADKLLADGCPFIKKLHFFDRRASYKSILNLKSALFTLSTQHREMVLRYLNRLYPNQTKRMLGATKFKWLLWTIAQSIIGVSKSENQNIHVRIFGIHIFCIKGKK